ncbi:DUF3800 domain-containing protein [Nioella sp.]|uniref:DUF3800 domain-containing protein n=1 Tax=Nioella sp. TaxID=1912091 RepID=UPI003A8B32B9
MYADEADQDAIEKTYLVYGAVYVPSENAKSICDKIRALKSEYGFAPDDPLKFSTGTIPKTVTRENHAAIKSKVLEVARTYQVKASCYVVFHDVAKNQGKETKLKYAINTLCSNFDSFIRQSEKHTGIAFFDRTTDFKQELYFKEILAHGLPKYDNTRIPIPRIIAINSTQEGLSPLNSLCDIVVGSLRFVFNEPDKDIVGEKLFNQLSGLLWGNKSPDGKTWYVLNKGLIFRPKTIDVPMYEADKQTTISMLKKYMDTDN